MISAFGVEHGVISKAAEDGKYVKAGVNDDKIRSRGERKAYRRGMAVPYVAGGALAGGSLYSAYKGKNKAAIGLGGAGIAATLGSQVTGHKAANKWRNKQGLQSRNYWTGKAEEV